MSNFEFQILPEGIELSLSKVGRKLFSTSLKKIPVRDWSSNDNSVLLSGLVALEPLIQELSIAELDSEKLLAPHDFVASLSDLQAHSLSLPVSIYQRIMSNGRLSNSYELDAELLDGNNEVYWTPVLARYCILEELNTEAIANL